MARSGSPTHLPGPTTNNANPDAGCKRPGVFRRQMNKLQFSLGRKWADCMTAKFVCPHRRRRRRCCRRRRPRCCQFGCPFNCCRCWLCSTTAGLLFLLMLAHLHLTRHHSRLASLSKLVNSTTTTDYRLTWRPLISRSHSIQRR